MLPTLAALAGAKVPTDRIVDGKDISDILLGTPGAKSPHEYLYYEYEGIRKGNWKLVDGKNMNANHAKKSGHKPGLLLFDLSKDIGETTNLAEQFPEKTQEMAAILAAHEKKVKSEARAAGSVAHAEPIDVTQKPTLVDYLGLKNIEVSATKPPKVKVRKKKNKKAKK